MGSFKILSFDGGGVRGAFGAAFIDELERCHGGTVADHFDLIAGASTGALLALALAFDVSRERLVDFYSNAAKDVFRRRPAVSGTSWYKKRILQLLALILPQFSQNGIDADWILAPKYTGAGLRNKLIDAFGDETLERSKRRVVIPAVDLTKGQTVVFKTPHCPNLVRDRRFKIVDIAIAAAAAPTYFPIAAIEAGSAYVDGGLWANDPALVAYVEADRIAKQCKREVDPHFQMEDVRILSIGTGERHFRLWPTGQEGILYWANQLLDLMGVCQSQGISFQMQHLLGERYRRVNFDIEKDWRLDDVRNLETLLHLGRESAREQFVAIRSEFLSSKAAPFASFPIGT